MKELLKKGNVWERGANGILIVGLLCLLLSGCRQFDAILYGNGEGYPGAKGGDGYPGDKGDQSQVTDPQVGPDLSRGVRYTWMDRGFTSCQGKRDQIHKTPEGRYYQLGNPCEPEQAPKEIAPSDVESSGRLLGFKEGVYQTEREAK